MTVYRRLERNGGGQAWKPIELGDQVEGEFQGLEDGQYGKLVVLETPEHGRRLIPVWATLTDQVQQLEVGHMYQFTLERFIRLKNGKEIRDIVVDEVLEDGEGEAGRVEEDVPF
jgi:hypothetical protein